MRWYYTVLLQGVRSAVIATTQVLATEQLSGCHLNILTEQHPLSMLVAGHLSHHHTLHGFTVS